jgi:hypothetical protein
MKKVILIFTLFCLFLNAKAQVINEIGLKTGLSISSVNWSNGFEPDIKTRFATSNYFYINYFNHKFWRISTNLGYTQKGVISHEKFTDLSGNVILEENRINSLDFCNLNLQLNIFYKVKFIKPFINFSPSLNYLFYHNGIFESYSEESINKITYNFQYSVGYDIYFKKFGIKTEFINEWNYKPIIETDFTNIQIKSKIICVGLMIEI